MTRHSGKPNKSRYINTVGCSMRHIPIHVRKVNNLKIKIITKTKSLRNAICNNAQDQISSPVCTFFFQLIKMRLLISNDQGI